jgi:hypothetical protein
LEPRAAFRIYIPFLGRSGMSQKAKDFRNRAARELRESRNGGSTDEKAANKKRAAALKSLSENEEWLNGEKPRRKERPRLKAAAGLAYRGRVRSKPQPPSP